MGAQKLYVLLLNYEILLDMRLSIFLFYKGLDITASEVSLNRLPESCLKSI